MRLSGPGLLVSLCLTIQGCVSCADWERARPYHCDPTLKQVTNGEDVQCGSGWRCGLEERCHPIGKPAAYTCATDFDCEAQWRCGPELKCLDATNEALRPNAFAGALRARQVSPRVSSEPALQVASASFPVPQACGPDVPAQTVAFVTEAGTVRSTEYPLGRRVLDADAGAGSCDAGPARHVFSSVGTAAPMTRPPLALADTPEATWVLGTSGQLCRFANLDGALGGCEGIKLDFAATALRSGRLPGLPLVARSEQRYVLITADGRTTAARRVAPVALGEEQPIHDLLPYQLIDGGAGLFAVTPAGAFAAEVPAPAPDGGSPEAPADEAWLPMHVPGIGCVSDPLPDPVGVLRSVAWAHGAPVLMGVIEKPDGSKHVAAFSGLGSGVGRPGCLAGQLDGVALGDPFTCAACPGEQLESFTAAPLDELGRFALELRCRSATGARSVWAARLEQGACTAERVVGPDAPLATVAGTAGPSTAATAGAAGEVWLQRGTGYSREARFLDRGPSLVLSGPGSLTVGAPAVSAQLQSGAIEVEAAQLFELREGEGLVARSGGADLLAAVEGTDRWVLRDATDAGSGNPPSVVELTPEGGKRLLAVFTSTETFKPPYRAVAAPGPDGGTLVVVTAFDALLAAELDAPSTPVLRVRLVPLNRSEITALTVLPRAAGGRYVEGWLVSAGRLHRFVADSPTVWKSDELPLPVGDPVALFHDGQRGRVAFADGRVYSLPGRVEIAPALPEGEGSARDFVDVCGQVLSIGDRSAFRLVTDGSSSIGQWQPVTLPQGGGKPSRLHATADGAYVFFDDGRVVRLEGLVCL